MAEFIIAKHRNGAVGHVLLRFKGEYIKFQNKDDDNFVPPPSPDGSSKGGVVLESKTNSEDFYIPPAPITDAPF